MFRSPPHELYFAGQMLHVLVGSVVANYCLIASEAACQILMSGLVLVRTCTDLFYSPFVILLFLSFDKSHNQHVHSGIAYPVHPCAAAGISPTCMAGRPKEVLSVMHAFPKSLDAIKAI